MSRRGLLGLALVGLAVGGIVVDRDHGAPAAARFGRPASTAAAALAPPGDALASTWFCPGVPASGDGSFVGSIDLLNEGPADRQAGITAYPSVAGGLAVHRDVVIAARSRTSILLSDLVKAPYAAAVVEVPGTAVAVEQSVGGPLGIDHQPCATSASSEWYGAAGATTLDATYTLLLFNPFPDTAVVDVGFLTGEGRRSPSNLQGVVVAGGSLQVIGVNEEVLRSPDAAAVITARAGRVVAGRIQRYDGSSSRKGTVSGLFASSLGSQWWFPDGAVGPTTHEFIVMANPSDTDASVQLEVDVAAPGEPITPLVVTVPSSGITTVTLDDKVPAGRHSIVVRSLNGTPLVVERRIDEADPAHLSTSSVIGSRVVAPRWAFVSGDVSLTSRSEIVVTNPGNTAATVTIAVLGAGGLSALHGFASVSLAPSASLRAPLADLVAPGPAPIIVIASTPVVVERVVIASDSPTASRTIGIAAVER